jgi:V/A-type H+-transporting ATPase subunit I
VLDQVPMLAFLFGVTGLALIFLDMGPSMSTAVFKYAAIGGSIGLVLTQGRAEKGIGAKLFYGIYNFYMALSGYLSDTLSYSRLWALALVTGVKAMTINLLTVNFGRMISASIPLIGRVPLLKTLVGIVIMALIFVLGHLVSLVMNLLSAFVHPLRLQFVEFFSKFFKPGGERFRPFRADHKYFNTK